jgi:hypothetical protein
VSSPDGHRSRSSGSAHPAALRSAVRRRVCSPSPPPRSGFQKRDGAGRGCDHADLVGRRPARHPSSRQTSGLSQLRAPGEMQLVQAKHPLRPLDLPPQLRDFTALGAHLCGRADARPGAPSARPPRANGARRAPGAHPRPGRRPALERGNPVGDRDRELLSLAVAQVRPSHGQDLVGAVPQGGADSEQVFCSEPDRFG